MRCRIVLLVIGFLSGCGAGTKTTVFFSSEQGLTVIIQKFQDERLPFLTDFDPQKFSTQKLPVRTRKGSTLRHILAFIHAGEWHLWWFPALPGATYKVILTPVTGDADLFIYFPEAKAFFPGVGFVPWLWSINPSGFPDALVFQTGLSYPFWVNGFQQRFIIVFGVTGSRYRLEVWRNF